MVVSYKIKQKKDNEVARSKVSASKTNMIPPKSSPAMGAEEFPTPQVSILQMYATFLGTEYYKDLFYLNRPATDN
jgi:hypothetical protein